MPDPEARLNRDQEEEGSIADTLQSVLGLATRRRWWIFLPACLITIASTLILPYLPTVYSSEATLVVVQQQVPAVFVAPSTLIAPSEAIRSLTREVRSRPRLLRIIEELGLYPQEKRNDDLADKMRERLEIEPLDPVRNDFNAFKVTFTASSPQLAQTVTSRVVSLFIEENLRSRGDQAERTDTFLSERLDEAKRKLSQQEDRLKTFKIANLGRLPEEQVSNLSALTTARAQLQNVTDNLTRSLQMRSSLESVLSGNFTRLEAERSELLSRFTAKHPQVAKKDAELSRTRVLLDRLRTASPIVEKAQAQASPEDMAFDQLRSQVETNTADFTRLSGEEKRLKAEITQYQNRLNLTPVTEQQLASIFRDYEQHKKDYSDLLTKQLQSHLTATLEERQQGQHFRLVDPPSLPHEPSSPKRMKILLGGAGAGLAIGLLLAFLIETLNSSFHSEKELTKAYPMPLMVAVPLLLTPKEARLRKWKTAFEYFAACVILMAVAVAEILVLGITSPKLL